jgi:hypothetical protein
VLVALRVGERGQHPQIETFSGGAFGDGVGRGGGDHQVGAERQVRAVLLDRAERLDDDGAGGDAGGHLGPAEVDQTLH